MLSLIFPRHLITSVLLSFLKALSSLPPPPPQLSCPVYRGSVYHVSLCNLILSLLLLHFLSSYLYLYLLLSYRHWLPLHIFPHCSYFTSYHILSYLFSFNGLSPYLLFCLIFLMLSQVSFLLRSCFSCCLISFFHFRSLISPLLHLLLRNFSSNPFRSYQTFCFHPIFYLILSHVISSCSLSFSLPCFHLLCLHLDPLSHRALPLLPSRHLRSHLITRMLFSLSSAL